MTKVMEFRAIRRGINRPIKARTAGYHLEILGITKKLFPDRALASFDAVGLLKGIQDSGYGQSRRKAIFELLKRTFADAVENGTIAKNPLAGRVPGQVPKKDRVLPTREQLEAMMEVIPQLFPRFGHRAVLSVRYLAFSGMRLMEARSVDWERDVGEDKIRVAGTEEGTKTNKIRVLDINPPLRAVLDDIGAMYGRKGRVMPALNIRPQLAAACKCLKIPVIDHHDLRGIWWWEVEQAAELGWISIEVRKGLRGRPSQIAKILGESPSAKDPPTRNEIGRNIRFCHRNFAIYSVTPVATAMLQSLRLHFGTEAYLLAYPRCNSRAAAAAGASRLMKRLDIRLMRRWLFCEAEGRVSGFIPATLAELIQELQSIGVVTIRRRRSV